MTRKTVAGAYQEAATALGGAYQRFQYGFGGQIEVLMTLLEKQHYQAAADIMPLIQREKVNFEALLLELQSGLETKMEHTQLQTIADEMAAMPHEGEPQVAAADVPA